MRPAERARRASTALVDHSIRGRIDLAAASVDLSDLGLAIFAAKAEMEADPKGAALWKAAFSIVQAERSEGLSWVGLLPLLHRLGDALDQVERAEAARATS